MGPPCSRVLLLAARENFPIDCTTAFSHFFVVVGRVLCAMATPQERCIIRLEEENSRLKERNATLSEEFVKVSLRNYPWLASAEARVDCQVDLIQERKRRGEGLRALKALQLQSQVGLKDSIGSAGAHLWL
jgi:hypothetical protein